MKATLRNLVLPGHAHGHGRGKPRDVQPVEPGQQEDRRSKGTGSFWNVGNGFTLSSPGFCKAAKGAGGFSGVAFFF